MGVLAALLLQEHACSQGEAVPFVMELPNYRLPGLKNVAQLLWEKARDFLQKAFTVIFAATIVIWFLQNFDLQSQPWSADPQDSILARDRRRYRPAVCAPGLCGLAGLHGPHRRLYGQGERGIHPADPLRLHGGPVGGFDPAHRRRPLLVFCLLYTPCMAAVAVSQAGAWRQVGHHAWW